MFRRCLFYKREREEGGRTRERLSKSEIVYKFKGLFEGIKEANRSLYVNRQLLQIASGQSIWAVGPCCVSLHPGCFEGPQRLWNPKTGSQHFWEPG